MQIDLTSPAQLSELLRRHNFHTKKRFGQNFLIDRNVVEKIVDTLDIHEGDPVLEIGPGAGVLTASLVERGARVVAVEIDVNLAPILAEVLGDRAEVVTADFLSLDLPTFLSERFGDARVKVAGNLPYYITSPIIGELLDAHGRIERVALMVQKEVAERLRARPGTKDYGSLSVFVQYHGEVEIVAQVTKNVFFPAPEVSSAVVLLRPFEAPPVEAPRELFFDVVHCAFGKRRKTLANSLSDCQSLGLAKEQVLAVLHDAGIDPSRRAETLSLAEFASIARAAQSRFTLR
ncbi:MAG: 16S rRNA (adenine(1518)-N(6)/adenine(1519)-N(6))-dimethyltransferase RsmA [Armatimonadota bacterium]